MTETARRTPGAPGGWVQLRDIEAEFGLRPKTVYSLRYRSDFPVGYRVAGRLRFRRDDIEQWILSKADRPRVAG